ncbi:hypothetical protein B4589_009815 [Halolamina sp. CBA1230]|uniref:hypothetical protein n=1 Tax=Halolamina sp. CBA1230 TaxID=1853690 RepID=UPI00117A8DE2|nr:hypothetical protein [Halolamina sp. CBA1230]QKY20660.1 hypothetical protein B4589_009815 [Halolamina sp. CBA1230]
MDEWTPSKDADAINGTKSRKDIEGADDTLGAIFPTKPGGIEFLRENNAWGFVNLNREPEFVLIYVSGSTKAVRYFARVQDIVPADVATLTRPAESYPQYDPSKSVVVFEPGTLQELTPEIQYREKTPYSLRYTTLGNVRDATGTDDLF